MSLSDRLKRKPHSLWSDEEIERHCELWAQNWVDTWNRDWGRIVNKIADRTNLSVDSVLFAMGFVQNYASLKKREELLARNEIDRLETMAGNRHCRDVNEHFEDVLVRVELLLANVETSPDK